MCFSATASFTTSAVLVGATVVTFTSLKTWKKPLQLFTLIPLIFAVQQFMEGLQWLALNHGGSNLPAAYIWLFFAYIFWPIFFPLAALQVETDPQRRKGIQVVLGLGIFSAIILGSTMFTQTPVVSLIGHSVSYGMDVPLYRVLAVTYVAAICLPGLFTRRYWFKIMSLVGFMALIVSYLAYAATFGSVWCFFAAIISVCVFLEMRSELLVLKKK